mmetsp:Transcript_19607/g.29781  ORF Transcript_19607/g.29781 Transcript_19607/m.29781 type:complete len:101 (+) Transcript_19607:639-941(+)
MRPRVMSLRVITTPAAARPYHVKAYPAWVKGEILNSPTVLGDGFTGYLLSSSSASVLPTATKSPLASPVTSCMVSTSIQYNRGGRLLKLWGGIMKRGFSP